MEWSPSAGVTAYMVGRQGDVVTDGLNHQPRITLAGRRDTRPCVPG